MTQLIDAYFATCVTQHSLDVRLVQGIYLVRLSVLAQAEESGNAAVNILAYTVNKNVILLQIGRAHV